MSNDTVTDQLARLGVEVCRYTDSAPLVDLYTGSGSGHGPTLTALSETEAAMLAAELAPDLLEALKLMVEVGQSVLGPGYHCTVEGMTDHQVMLMACEAIERAEGRSE